MVKYYQNIGKRDKLINCEATVCVIGPPGCGKTTLTRLFASHCTYNPPKRGKRVGDGYRNGLEIAVNSLQPDTTDYQGEVTVNGVHVKVCATDVPGDKCSPEFLDDPASAVNVASVSGCCIVCFKSSISESLKEAETLLRLVAQEKEPAPVCAILCETCCDESGSEGSPKAKQLAQEMKIPFVCTSAVCDPDSVIACFEEAAKAALKATGLDLDQYLDQEKMTTDDVIREEFDYSGFDKEGKRRKCGCCLLM